MISFSTKPCITIKISLNFQSSLKKRLLELNGCLLAAAYYLLGPVVNSMRGWSAKISTIVQAMTEVGAFVDTV